ncbi:MAG: diaminopimelate epimerase [Bacteroidales bacterium]
MKFTKMHGAGNDYIYINGLCENINNPEMLSRRISNRNFGIGSDGLVLILPSEIADIKMRMFNADGSEAEMCGNASRCVAKYVYEEGIVKKDIITLETKAGIKTLHLNFENNKISSVTVDMGQPCFAPEKIPTTILANPIINHPITIDGVEYRATVLSMGNPHAVIFINSFNEIELHKVGREIELHEYFPKATNVEFVETISRDTLRMRVWERGSGETLACGTGACATLVAAVLNGICDRKATLKLIGGDLEIEWRESNNHVFMTGGATRVFDGTLIDPEDQKV